MISAIKTGAGIWNPLVLLAALVLVLIVVYIIRAIGNKKYMKGTAQVKPFMSGNVHVPKEEVRSSDMYWGFMEAFRSVYGPLVRWHTGIVNDYVGAFVVVLALLIIILLIL